MLYERKREKSLKPMCFTSENQKTPMCFLVFATLRKVFWKSQDAQKERLEPKQPQNDFFNLKTIILQQELLDDFFSIFLESFLRSSQKIPETTKRLKTHAPAHKKEKKV